MMVIVFATNIHPPAGGTQKIGYDIIYYGSCTLGRTGLLFVITRVLFTYFFISLIIADGPYHYHPVNARSHEGSSHLSPVHALRSFIAMQVQYSYNSSTNG